MKALRAMLAAAALTWAVAAGAVGWVGVPLRNGANVSVPDVTAGSLAQADIDLEAVGLDTGTTTAVCSLEAANEVTSQSPAAGASVALGSLVDLNYSSGVACAYDLSGIPTGWYSIANVMTDNEFVALMREEATNGGGDWAYWQPGTDIRGTSQLRLNLAAIIAEADGAAVWARWSPGTTARATGNLQLNMQEALNNDFL